MFQGTNLNDDVLKRFLRVLSPTEVLFEEGKMANTLFIIISGAMELLEKRGEEQIVINTIGAGEIIGDTAILSVSPYRRVYSARAKTETMLIEFEGKNVKLIESVIPNFTHRVLQLVATRLDRANRVISLLRSINPIERLVQGILFLAEEGKKTTEGIEVTMTAEDLYHLIYIDKEIIDEGLKHLIRNKILLKTKDGFLIKDTNALSQYKGELEERIAA